MTIFSPIVNPRLTFQDKIVQYTPYAQKMTDKKIQRDDLDAKGTPENPKCSTMQFGKLDASVFMQDPAILQELPDKNNRAARGKEMVDNMLHALESVPIFAFLFKNTGLTAVLAGSSPITALGSADNLPFSCARNPDESDEGYYIRFACYLLGGINGPVSMMNTPETNDAGFEFYLTAEKIYTEIEEHPFDTPWIENKWSIRFDEWCWDNFDEPAVRMDWKNVDELFDVIRDTPFAEAFKTFRSQPKMIFMPAGSEEKTSVLQGLDFETAKKFYQFLNKNPALISFKLREFLKEQMKLAGFDIEELQRISAAPETITADFRQQLEATGIRIPKRFLVLPFEGQPLGETRTTYYLPAFGRPVEHVRILAFGKCNFECPYCIRHGQYQDEEGRIVAAVECNSEIVFAKLEEALAKNERIRLSGGDPCMHPKDSLAVARWSMDHGKKVTYCHNGSSPKFVDTMLPFTEYAAIDLKGGTSDELALRAGLGIDCGARMLQNSLACQRILADAGKPVDVRSCIFSTTTFSDMCRLAEMICNNGNTQNKVWTIRAYNPIPGLEWEPMQREQTLDYIQKISARFPDLLIAYRVQWIGGGLQFWKGGKILKF